MARPIQKHSIQETVVDGLTSGRLWMLDGDPIWAGRGVLKPCIVCQLKIREDQRQYDVLAPGRSASVHASCHQVWRWESDKLRMKPPG